MSTTALVVQQQQKVASLRSLLDKSKDQIRLALPKHLTAERMIRVAMTAIQRTPALLECDQLSIVGSIVQASQLGLECDGVLGLAYLVPYFNKKTQRKECQLIVGYKGLVALARRSGEVSTIAANVVFENDFFDYSYGLEEKLNHKPARGDRGVPIYAYAYVKLKDGGHQFEVMSTEDVEAVRHRSKAAESGPWVSDWNEMARKTPLRRLAKFMPLSVEFAKAAALDEYADAGLPQQLDAELESSEVVREGTEQRTQQLVDKYTKPQPIVDALEITDQDTQLEQGESPNPQSQPASAETQAREVESAQTSQPSPKPTRHRGQTQHGVIGVFNSGTHRDEG